MKLNSDEGGDSKNKIEVISKIDELKVIANNHYLRGKYDEAIKIAEEIINKICSSSYHLMSKNCRKHIFKNFSEEVFSNTAEEPGLTV